jgi:membrane associated rhomboid family serine protease
MRQRPLGLGLYWRTATGPQGISSPARCREWLLVLSACGIPFRLHHFDGRDHIYVPALLVGKARAELGAFADEPRRQRARTHRPLHDAWLPACLFPLLLILWNGWSHGLLPLVGGVPARAAIDSLGALDAVRVRIYGEWYRTVTALVLHADTAHLLGNVAFGMLFLAFSARLVGAGRAVWLTMLGGALANGAAVLLRSAAVTSIGFSTALFATIGLQSGYMACTGWRRNRYLLPLAGGAGLLAMLGTEGVNTDYLAHVTGLLSGTALGVLEAVRLRNGWPGFGQAAGYVLAVLLPVVCWVMAFR